jgi:hypothetical protein
MSDERKAFEAWYESPTRPFCESDTSAWGAAWAAWQARAALTQATATAAPLPSSPESAGSDSSEPLSAAHWTTPCIPPAGVAQEAGALLRDPVKTPEKDAREWVNRLGDQYAARQVAALRADDKAIDAANFWIGTIALEHVFDILQSVRPAPIQEAGAREPVAWMHECRHLSCDAEDGAVISAKSKEIWMGAKPEHVEHYTIPLYDHPPTTGAADYGDAGGAGGAQVGAAMSDERLERDDELLLRNMARDFVKGGGPMPHNADALVERAYKIGRIAGEARLWRENLELRSAVAGLYAGAALYRDDGELQDNRRTPFIDFKRDSLLDIRIKMTQRAALTQGEATAAPLQSPTESLCTAPAPDPVKYMLAVLAVRKWVRR